MSNFLAIASVTAALQNLLTTNISNIVSGAAIKIGPPKAATVGQTAPGVNIFLYQVTPNHAFRNMDLPTRDNRCYPDQTCGKLLQQPRIALDLFYLLNFVGNEQNLEPQRLLGHVISTLHVQPILTKELIASSIVTFDPNQSLVHSDLANTLIEQIKLTLHSNPFEEIAKLWTSFFNQIPYTLSIVYQASVVFIDGAEKIVPSTAVKEIQLQVNPANSE